MELQNRSQQESWAGRMIEWLDAEIAGCEARREALNADAREDEAVFEKIRANVYGIYRTLLFAAENAGHEPGNARRFLEARLDRIPSQWSAAFEEARRHGDIGRMVVESIKLDTVRKIREELNRAWGEEA